MTTPKVGFQGVVFKLCDSHQSLTSTLWVEIEWGGSIEGQHFLVEGLAVVIRGGVASVVILVFKLSEYLKCVPSDAGFGSLGVRAAAAAAAEHGPLRAALAHVRAVLGQALMWKLRVS